jgi:hypothetical protein
MLVDHDFLLLRTGPADSSLGAAGVELVPIVQAQTALHLGLTFVNQLQ